MPHVIPNAYGRLISATGPKSDISRIPSSCSISQFAPKKMFARERSRRRRSGSVRWKPGEDKHSPVRRARCATHLKTAMTEVRPANEGPDQNNPSVPLEAVTPKKENDSEFIAIERRESEQSQSKLEPTRRDRSIRVLRNQSRLREVPR